MKNHFYKIAMLVLVSGLLTVSCKKENAAPTAKKQTTGTTSKITGDTESSTPESPYNTPPSGGGCPGHK